MIRFENGDALRRVLDPQVAARHHDAVGRLEDLLEILDRLPPLDLRDDDRRTLRSAKEPSQADQIVGAPHEREGDEVHPLLDPELEVATILGGQRRSRAWPGKLTPLWSLILPPVTTRQRKPAAAFFTTRSSTFPSSISTRSPIEMSRISPE